MYGGLLRFKASERWVNIRWSGQAMNLLSAVIIIRKKSLPSFPGLCVSSDVEENLTAMRLSQLRPRRLANYVQIGILCGTNHFGHTVGFYVGNSNKGELF